MRLEDHGAASETAVKADDGPLLATDVDGVAALEMRWRAMRLALMAKVVVSFQRQSLSRVLPQHGQGRAGLDVCMAQSGFRRRFSSFSRRRLTPSICTFHWFFNALLRSQAD